jgi:hypothetical protein
LFFILKSELKGDQGKGLRIKIPIRTNKKLLYLIRSLTKEFGGSIVLSGV